MTHFKYFKLLYKKKTQIFFKDNICVVSGFLINDEFKFSKNSLIKLNEDKYLIHKNYIRTFFSTLNSYITGVSCGFKIILYLKGKGLRIQLKKQMDGTLFLYLKLGYSHKLLYKLPKNIWVNLVERRRTIVFFGLNYSILKLLVSKFRQFYPLSLYKLRGFYSMNEILKQKKGKSKLTSNY